MNNDNKKNNEAGSNHQANYSSKVNALAGIMAGAANAIAIAPLDVVRVRLQAQVVIPGYEQRYKGPKDAFRTILREEGLPGFFRGLSVTLFGYGPTWGVYFTFYQGFKKELNEKNILTKTPDLQTLVASVSAGGIANIMTNPIWVIRTRLQTQEYYRQKPMYSSGLDALRKMIHAEGIKSLFKGLTPQLLGLINVAITFPLYERLKKLRFRSNKNGELFDFDDGLVWYFDNKDFDPNDKRVMLRLGTQIFASSVSKAIASTITYPLEVIRTRHHIQVVDSTHPAKYKSALQTFRLIIKEEGRGALYAGLSANLLRVVPASAVTLTTYEYISAILHDLGL